MTKLIPVTTLTKPERGAPVPEHQSWNALQSSNGCFFFRARDGVTRTRKRYAIYQPTDENS